MDKVTNDFEIPCAECGVSHGHHRAGCSRAVRAGMAPHFTTQETRQVELRELHDAPELKESDAPGFIPKVVA